MNAVPALGSGTPAAACALANAVGKSRAMPITSPVERISGPSTRVGALEAVERQHGLLDRDVLAVADPLAPCGQAEVGDPLAEHDPAGELRERHADRLGDERHGARGARVGLDHVQLAGVRRRTGR